MPESFSEGLLLALALALGVVVVCTRPRDDKRLVLALSGFEAALADDCGLL